MADEPTSGKPQSAARRLLGGYFSAIFAGAKGALGVEGMRYTGRLLKNALHNAKAQACPRCGEPSLFPIDDPKWKWACVYEQCGLRATQAQIDHLKANMLPADVLAVAKGLAFQDIEKRIRGAQIVSRAMWIFSLGFLTYALSWIWDGRPMMFTWSFLLSFGIALQGFRYAFRVWQARNHIRGGLGRFARMPAAWFV